MFLKTPSPSVPAPLIVPPVIFALGAAGWEEVGPVAARNASAMQHLLQSFIACLRHCFRGPKKSLRALRNFAKSSTIDVPLIASFLSFISRACFFEIALSDGDRKRTRLT